MELPPSRLHSLYKDFRPLKELNPDGYAANISTWKEYLKDHTLTRGCQFSLGTQLLQELSKDIYGFPKSLDVVIDALVQEGYLIYSDDFYAQRMYSKEYPRLMQWIGFGKNRFFKSRQSENGYYLKELKLIVRPNVESKFKDITARINDRIIKEATGITDLILPLTEFCTKVGLHEIIEDESDKEVLLFYLSRYTGTLFNESDFVKIVDPTRGNNAISENDRRIADLKMAISSVSKQVGKMRNERIDHSKLLTQSIREGASKDTQRRFLQARKIAEKYLNRLLDYQSNLLEIKSQIEMAITNEILVTTLSDSNETLKSIAKYSLSVDQVEDLLDDVKDHRERNEEIRRLLSGTDETIDEETLDAELESLDKQLEGRESTPEVLDRLSHLNLSDNNEKTSVNETHKKEETNSKQLVPEHD